MPTLVSAIPHNGIALTIPVWRRTPKWHGEGAIYHHDGAVHEQDGDKLEAAGTSREGSVMGGGLVVR
jgi:hypothetical protein